MLEYCRSFLYPLALLMILVFFWVRFTTRRKILKLPPGPWKLPILGNLHQMVSKTGPHVQLSMLAKKYGPIMQLKLGELQAIVISSPEIATEVLKTNDVVFAQRPHMLAVEILSIHRWGPVFCPYGDHWKQVRKICVAELLTAKRVQSFRNIREEEVWRVIESISSSHNDGVPFNLSRMINSLTISIASRTIIGKRFNEQDEFKQMVKKMFDLSGGFDLPDLFPSLKFLSMITGAKAALEKLSIQENRIVDSIIEEHRLKRTSARSNKSDDDVDKPSHHQEQDFVDLLLNLQELGGLDFDITDDHIKAIVMDMFIAASDTTATTIDWTMSELLRNPRIMKKAQAEIRQAFQGKVKLNESDIHQLDYLKLVVKESLRLHPPGTLLIRESRETCEVSGYEIPAHSHMIINTWKMARDSEYWDDGDKFWPERFLDSSIDFKGAHFEFLPFGAGRRICPGISFSMINIELFIAQLLYHFDWELPNGMNPEELDMTESFSFTCTRKHDLHVITIPCRNFLNG